jgi:hypothetical protein
VVYFQVIDAQNNVKVNEPFRTPLLHVVQEIETRFKARNEEHEVQMGLFRFPVPDYSPTGFREALNNACCIVIITGWMPCISSGSMTIFSLPTQAVSLKV